MADGDAGTGWTDDGAADDEGADDEGAADEGAADDAGARDLETVTTGPKPTSVQRTRRGQRAVQQVGGVGLIADGMDRRPQVIVEFTHRGTPSSPTCV